MRPILRLTVLVGVVMVAAIPGVTAAFADQYGSSGVTVSTSTPGPGGSDTVTADGFKPGSSADIFIFSTPVLLGKATADANGAISAKVTIPSSFAGGSQHTIEVEGVGPTGAALTESLPITLGAASSSSGSGGGLAFTGVHIAELSGTGVALVALGAFMVFTFRRRRAVTKS
jgi:hypothetical protein